MSDLSIQAGSDSFTGGSVSKRTGKKESGFGETMKNAIERVNKEDIAADRGIVDLLQGKTGVGEAMLALQKADTSVRMLLAFRNKALDAYREIMHMQF